MLTAKWLELEGNQGRVDTQAVGCRSVYLLRETMRTGSWAAIKTVNLIPIQNCTSLSR